MSKPRRRRLPLRYGRPHERRPPGLTIDDIGDGGFLIIGIRYEGCFARNATKASDTFLTGLTF